MELALTKTFIPELGTPVRGKVRDIYDLGDTLTLIASDRTSIFDVPLVKPLPGKGKILTEISKFWFRKTQDIIPNHLLSSPDPNVMIVKRCKPLPLEVIVRGYLCGSLWRDYATGRREKCGVPLPEGLEENAPLPQPILTPTTKAHQGHDEDISEEEILSKGLVSQDIWEKVKKASYHLFKRGTEVLKEKGIILVDTKYEFGIDTEGDLILIDEIHTPDSSRFWQASEYEKKQIRFPDKEFLRAWSKANNVPPTQPFPDEVMEEASKRYREVFKQLTASDIKPSYENPSKRLIASLKKSGVIQGRFALFLTEGEKGRKEVERLSEAFDGRNIPNQWIPLSLEEENEKSGNLIQAFNDSMEPVVIVIIAKSPAELASFVAQKTKWPVIACSLASLPGPVLSAIDPEHAALAAERIFEIGEIL